MRDVTNWYLSVEPFREPLSQWLSRLTEDKAWREFAIREVVEYFGLPALYIKRDDLEQVDEAAVLGKLPPFEREPSKSKSDKFIFKSLADRDQAKLELGKANVRYRAGRTLVPFRLTGNLDWGLAAPEIEGLSGLTFWVWPESLWAPILFTAAVLASRGQPISDWKQWWCSKDSQVNQFIGEDNLFFMVWLKWPCSWACKASRWLPIHRKANCNFPKSSPTITCCSWIKRPVAAVKLNRPARENYWTGTHPIKSACTSSAWVWD